MEQISGEIKKDFSYLLELAEEKKKELSEIDDKIAERKKFLETEKEILRFPKEKRTALVNVRKREEAISLIGEEIIELEKRRNTIKTDMGELLSGHKMMTNMLEDFNPDIEH